MSEKNSLIKSGTLQKNLFRRRLWVILLAFLVFLIYFAGFTAYMLLGVKSAATGHYTPDILYMTREANNACLTVITVVGAALLGMQGFAWLDSRRGTDFYGSLPVSASKRFWNIVLNSWIIYLVSYAVSLGVGLIVFAANGYFSRVLLQIELRCLVRNIYLFAAIYGGTVFSMMIAGNFVVALFIDAALFLYEPFCDLLYYQYMTAMQASFPGGTTLWTYVFSPIALQITGSRRWLNLVEGAVILILTFLLYRLRRNENAGRAVVFAPAKHVLKAAAQFVIALEAGILFYEAGGIAPAIAAAVIAAVLVGMILEVVFSYNIRHCLANPGGTLGMAAAVGVLIWLAYVDVLGFGIWTPAPSAVQSAYVYCNDDYMTSILEDGEAAYASSDYAEKYMRLTDIETVNALLREGEENAARIQRGQEDGSDFKSWYFGFRMKNGRTEARLVYLNASSAELLDKLVTSSEFQQGYYPLYHDSYVAEHADKASVTYWNGSYDENGYAPELDAVDGGEIYPELSDALREDLAGLTWTYASGHYPVGEVTIDVEIQGQDGLTDIISEILPVYEDFDRTLQVLRQYGIYTEPTESAEENDSLSSVAMY